MQRLIKNLRSLVPMVVIAVAFLGVTAFLLLVSMNPNHPPEAVAESSMDFVEVGEIILFDGTNSSDPDGDELSFTWILPFNMTVTSSMFHFSFTESGNYTVQLEVVDSDGKLDRDTLTIDVHDE